jgi:hypothetical protein
MQGNPTDIPVFGTCGFRYQEGDTATPRCSCGMFSVGACARCGAMLCGQHGSHDSGSYFVCNHHIADDRKNTLEEQRRHDKRELEEAKAELEEAKAAVQREREALELIVPDFPHGGAARGSELAQVLERLVPNKKQSFPAGQKSFGRKRYVHGWGFATECKQDSEIRGWWWRGMVVESDGTLHFAREQAMEGWHPTHVLSRSGMPDGTCSIGGDELRAVLEQILDWMGKHPETRPTLRQRFLVEFEHIFAVPVFEAWCHGKREDGRPDWLD